jgi:hypothetical protein
MDETQIGLLPMGDRDFKNKQEWQKVYQSTPSKQFGLTECRVNFIKISKIILPLIYF